MEETSRGHLVQPFTQSQANIKIDKIAQSHVLLNLEDLQG